MFISNMTSFKSQIRLWPRSVWEIFGSNSKCSNGIHQLVSFSRFFILNGFIWFLRYMNYNWPCVEILQNIASFFLCYTSETEDNLKYLTTYKIRISDKWIYDKIYPDHVSFQIKTLIDKSVNSIRSPVKKKCKRKYLCDIKLLSQTKYGPNNANSITYRGAVDL